MEDETSNPNIEWKKKKGFDNKERLTLKTNVKKAVQYEATKKKPVANAFSPLPSDLPKGLKKIRKKIKDIYDDDEDENEYDFIPAPTDINNSLINALHEDEKRQLQQRETIKNNTMLQNAGKMEALIMADRITREMGMKGLDKKTLNNNMLDVSMNSQTYENALKEDIAKKAKINGRRLSSGETITLLRGIKRIQSMAAQADEPKIKAIEGWKIDEIVNAGKDSLGSLSDKELAKKILEKSGRKADTKQAEKMAKNSKNKTKAKNKETYQKIELYRD